MGGHVKRSLMDGRAFGEVSEELNSNKNKKRLRVMIIHGKLGSIKIYHSHKTPSQLLFL